MAKLQIRKDGQIFLLMILFSLTAFLSACTGGCGRDGDSAEDDDNPSPDDDTHGEQVNGSTELAMDELPDNSITVWDQDGLMIEMILGGRPGYRGHDMVVAPDGGISVASVKGRTLFLYRIAKDGGVSKEILAHFCWFPALARDENGFLHIAFVDTRRWKYVYATDKTGAWSFQDIDDAGTTNSEYGLPKIKIALDHQKIPHVVYRDYNENAIYISEWKPQGWNRTLIANYPDDVPQMEIKRLVFDSNDFAHVIYFYQWLIVYASNTSGEWHIEGVNGEQGGGISIFLLTDRVGPILLGMRVMKKTRSIMR